LITETVGEVFILKFVGMLPCAAEGAVAHLGHAIEARQLGLRKDLDGFLTEQDLQRGIEPIGRADLRLAHADGCGQESAVSDLCAGIDHFLTGHGEGSADLTGC
jgi:hypothetical protein